jgi:hypothetical protein
MSKNKISNLEGKLSNINNMSVDKKTDKMVAFAMESNNRCYVNNFMKWLYLQIIPIELKYRKKISSNLNKLYEDKKELKKVLINCLNNHPTLRNELDKKNPNDAILQCYLGYAIALAVTK